MDYVVNFASYASDCADILDNSSLMFLRLCIALGVKEVSTAGMDGYSSISRNDYFDQHLVFDFSDIAEERNGLISNELKDIQKKLKMQFITPTYYIVNA